MDRSRLSLPHDSRDNVPFLHRAVPPALPEPVDCLPFCDDVPSRRPEAPALVNPAEPIVERAVRSLLQGDIQRCLDRKAVLVELLGSVAALQFLAHLFDEIGGNGRLGGGFAAQDNRLFPALLGLFGGDVAHLGHPAQRVISPPHGSVHVHIRALADVPLEDARNQGRFLERDLARRLPEVEP